ncbi:F1-FO ATP synthase subunit J [Schizosaccharomyces pombe]|uniref:ATP synthase subunit J, mitochondrial n=1 Tax=Schizosaccharomyces pombe (strain 972 / ATCC 24843) TaxID=284812 RepID=ATP18_SCHPO|nr:putative F0-ATPase subunit J [Schizosaccharomyces pombe]O13931.1 RecName: Full=ATP synthase subunit J, mitochondrial [Schizosaccharomyces pombe 972h-]CAB16882.1 F0-ATPase subunit J (predicted) [Schizosaccharomyces pombe]|eukprot:NP_593183.1 putative F0-ATPase subunit J [Schizosaccharomyces pombe]
MSFFGLKRYSTPILKPMLPFFLGGAIVFYGTVKLRDAMMDSAEYRNDPRNPKAGKYGSDH